MAEQTVIENIKRFLRVVASQGIRQPSAVLFGSYANGAQTNLSDVDVLVVSPTFDESKDYQLKRKLWHATLDSDSRIEPIPCGLKEWEEGGGGMIVDEARRHGVRITV